MLFRMLREGLCVPVLGVLLSLQAPLAPCFPTAAVVGFAAALTAVAVPTTVAEAQSRARSSGGYSRPGRSAGRTPSFGGAYPRGPRTPSTSSGGYGRPSGGYAAPRRPSITFPSAGDRTISRQQSADALRRYRDQQAAARRQQTSLPTPAPPSTTAPIPVPGPFGGRTGGGSGYGYGPGYGGPGYRPDYGYGYGYGSGWFGRRGWSVPDYAYRTGSSFGIWDGLFLWFLLDNLTRPGYADFFHHHRDDPGYQEWRAEAERLGRENEQIRRQLDGLDRQLAEKEGQPRDPAYLPPDTPPEVAVAAPKATGDARTPTTAPASIPVGEAAASELGAAADAGGFGLPLTMLVVVGGGAALMLARRRQAAGASDTTRAGGGGTTGTIQSARNILRRKVSGEAYAPSRFRVGMTLTVDPTPFILVAGVTKVPAPEAAGANALVSVSAVGTLDAGAARLTRLYLPGESSFFQLHLRGGPGGEPDECRYFGRIDEVAPADDAEWAFWLDPAEGAIGWPEFQTKDGKVYQRAWAPGVGRVAPQELAERIETAAGARDVRRLAMLYAAPTGAQAPAPETEYVLVAAVEDGGQAWVEVHAGLDVNPAVLQLA
jgi:hypothetical protein